MTEYCTTVLGIDTEGIRSHLTFSGKLGLPALRLLFEQFIRDKDVYNIIITKSGYETITKLVKEDG